MTFQAYTDGEDTIYGTSPEEAVVAYRAEVGIDADNGYDTAELHDIVADARKAVGR